MDSTNSPRVDLTQKHCVPCKGGMPPMGAEEIEKYKADIPGWEVVDNNGFNEAHHKGFDKSFDPESQDRRAHPRKIRREFKFKDFRGSIDFVKKVADIAEAEGHHPDIYIFYNLVRLELSTHAVGGLSENDFILAAKINLIN